jgi:hypothetical protein
MSPADEKAPNPVKVVGIDDGRLLSDSTHVEFREDCCAVTFILRPAPSARWKELFDAEAPQSGYDGCVPAPDNFVFGNDRTPNALRIWGIHVDDIPQHAEVLRLRVARVNRKISADISLASIRAKQERKREGLCLERRILKAVGHLPFGDA